MHLFFNASSFKQVLVSLILSDFLISSVISSVNILFSIFDISVLSSIITSVVGGSKQIFDFLSSSVLKVYSYLQVKQYLFVPIKHKPQLFRQSVVKSLFKLILKKDNLPLYFSFLKFSSVSSS